MGESQSNREINLVAFKINLEPLLNFTVRTP